MATRRTAQNPMPREQGAFLDAIIRNPDDDTVRLVYADWLQENGDEERAEFIRLQILLSSRHDILNRGEFEARALRRAYADWLQEKGERSRAGILRDHIRQSRLGDLEDHVIRHAYADWLQEAGKVERAAWHRPSFLLTRRDPLRDRAKLEARAARLLAGRRPDWPRIRSFCATASSLTRPRPEVAPFFSGSEAAPP